MVNLSWIFVIDIWTFYLSLYFSRTLGTFLFLKMRILERNVGFYISMKKLRKFLWQGKLEAFSFRDIRYIACVDISISISTYLYTLTYTLTHISICTHTQHKTHLHIYILHNNTSHIVKYIYIDELHPTCSN